MTCVTGIDSHRWRPCKCLQKDSGIIGKSKLQSWLYLVPKFSRLSMLFGSDCPEVFFPLKCIQQYAVLWSLQKILKTGILWEQECTFCPSLQVHGDTQFTLEICVQHLHFCMSRYLPCKLISVLSCNWKLHACTCIDATRSSVWILLTELSSTQVCLMEF